MKISVCVKKKYKLGNKSLGLIDSSGIRLSEKLSAYVRTMFKSPNVSTDHLINFGCTTITNIDRYRTVLNHPDRVKLAVDKIATLSILNSLGIPSLSFTTNMTTAQNWAKSKDQWVICRKLIKSNSGKGIVIAKTPIEVTGSKLYTLYYKKKSEYRYHIFKGKVICVQKKKRISTDELNKRGFKERPPSYIRNLANGYIFAKEGVKEVKEMSDICIKAVEALGLDFAAVDILCKEEEGIYIESVVCEINTAPGLQESTLTSYNTAFSNYYNLLIENKANIFDV